jgi:outer membrane protein TolC
MNARLLTPIVFTFLAHGALAAEVPSHPGESMPFVVVDTPEPGVSLDAAAPVAEPADTGSGIVVQPGGASSVTGSEAIGATMPLEVAPSLALAEIWRLAFEHNPGLVDQAATIKIKDKDAAAARAEYNLDVMLTGRAATEDSNQNNNDPQQQNSDSVDNRYYGELSVTLPFWHKRPEAIEGQQALVDAALAREEFANLARSLQFDVFNAYLDAVVSEEILAIDREATTGARSRSRAAAENYRMGRLSETHELSERAYALDKQAEGARSALALGESKRSLNALMGHVLPGRWTPIASTLTAALLPVETLQSRSITDFPFRDNALSALRQQLEIRKQAWWFQARLSARGYGFSGDQNGGTESGFGGALVLQIPFPDINLTRKRVAAARGEAADLDRKLTDEKVWYAQEVRRSWSDLYENRELNEILDELVSVKRREYDVALQDVKLGKITRPELQYTEDQLIRWREELARVKGNELGIRAKLQYLTVGYLFDPCEQKETEMVKGLRQDRSVRGLLNHHPALRAIGETPAGK